VWDAIQEFYRQRGIGEPVGFGQRPAVVLVDYMKSFTDPASPLGADFDAEVEATLRLLAVARTRHIPRIFTVVSYDANYREAGVFAIKFPAIKMLVAGSDASALDERLNVQPDEHVLVKKFASAFFGTSLTSLLTGYGADTVIVTGFSTSGCVRATVVDSLQSGFRTIVPRECVGDRAELPHAANLFDINAKYGDVVDLSVVLDYLTHLQAWH
jgi:nicotinamidase-related amidase